MIHTDCLLDIAGSLVGDVPKSDISIEDDDDEPINDIENELTTRDTVRRSVIANIDEYSINKDDSDIIKYTNTFIDEVVSMLLEIRNERTFLPKSIRSQSDHLNKQNKRKSKLPRSRYDAENECVIEKKIYIDCYFCNKTILKNESERCHMTPQSIGGDWSVKNIKLGCRECNRKMSNMDGITYKNMLTGNLTITSN